MHTPAGSDVQAIWSDHLVRGEVVVNVLVPESGDGQSVVDVAHQAADRETEETLKWSPTSNMTQLTASSSSLYISCGAVSTRPILVAVDQPRDEIWGHADDQPVGDDGQHPDGLKHVNPHTWSKSCFRAQENPSTNPTVQFNQRFLPKEFKPPCGSGHSPMSLVFFGTSRRSKVTILMASSRISMMLLMSANSGASGKAATKMVVKLNWITEDRQQRERKLITDGCKLCFCLPREETMTWDLFTV